jgi:hypothetical protein
VKQVSSTPEDFGCIHIYIYMLLAVYICIFIFHFLCGMSPGGGIERCTSMKLTKPDLKFFIGWPPVRLQIQMIVCVLSVYVCCLCVACITGVLQIQKNEESE